MTEAELPKGDFVVGAKDTGAVVVAIVAIGVSLFKDPKMLGFKALF